jgi:4-carboxymuconolactone decarboxylase
MARVTLVDAETHPQLSEQISYISGARQGRLINVYRMLLNSPSIATAWVDFNNAVRLGSTLDARSRELAIIRVAIVNRTEYIFRAHVPGHAKQAGITDDELDGVFDWQSYEGFSARDRTVLAYVDAMTRDIEVSDEVFDAVRKHFDEGRTVELTVLIGAYNMHSRMGRALKIDLEPSWDLSAARWK